MKYQLRIQIWLVSVFIFELFFTLNIRAQTINTIAGGLGDTYGAATCGRLSIPQAITVDALGNIYFAENGGTGNISRVRKISTSGIITTVAGNGLTNWNGFGGLAINAEVGRPEGVAIDAAGNLLISYSKYIGKVNSLGILNVFAGNGTGGFTGDGSLSSTAELDNPWGIAIDGAGNVFFADRNNGRIRKINTLGIITTVAGGGSSLGDGGPAIAARLDNPTGVAVDAAGNIYIADGGNHRVRKVNTLGLISTIAGNGSGGTYTSGVPATSTAIGTPIDVKVDGSGNVYVSGGAVLKINTSGIITTFAGGISGFSGDGGPATAAGLSAAGITFDAAGNMLIADAGNNRIRKVNTSGIIATIAGNGLPTIGFGGDGGPATLGVFGLLSGSGIVEVSGYYTLRGWVPAVAVDHRGNTFITDVNNQRIRKVNSSGTITTIAGNGIAGFFGDGGPATAAELDQPIGISFDGIGNLFFAEYGSHHIRKIDTFGTITTVAGGGSGGLGDGGPATAAVISAAGLCVDSIGNIFVVDIDSQRIRKVNAATGIITTVAGNGVAGFNGDGGPATNANLNHPIGVAVDKTGNIYISDHANSRLRKVDTNGIITTFAGNGTYAGDIEINLGDYGPATSATITYPMGVTTDRYGNVIFSDHGRGPGNVYDSFSSAYTRIRLIDRYGYIQTVAGNGIEGYAGDGGMATAAEFLNPWGVAVDTSGNLFIADNGNFSVRKACCLPNPTDHPPSFTGGSIQRLNICAGSSAVSINPIMAVSDLDIGDTERWTVTDFPRHGTLGGFPGTATSTGGTIVPSGMTYTPATGFSGLDTFIIKISDGYYYTPTMVIVSINPLPIAGTISGPASVCAGATILLTDTAPGGIWSASNSHASVGSSTGLVTGVTAGIDTIRYTVTNGCGSAIATQIVTINGLPVVSAITGPATVCVSSTITLSDATSGGTWSSPDPYVAVGLSSGVVAGIAPGVAAINYEVTNSCGTTAVSRFVTVNPVPSAGTITGTTIICTGGTTTLSDAVPGGIWSSGSTAVATIGSTGIVTGIAVGSAVISYTISGAGCGSAAAITIINVTAATPILPITGPSSVCTGSTIALADASPGGTWSSSNPSIATIGSTGIVSGITGGTTTISYTASLGCGVSIAAANITVNTSPYAGILSGIVTLCSGATGTVSSSVPGGIWVASNGNATVSPTGLVTGVTAGSDTLTYTVTNSCGSASASHVVNVYAAPNAGTITGTTVLCAGSTVTLTDAAPGGIWSSGNPSIATAGSAGVITGIASGSANISYTVTTGCGTASAVKTVTVNTASAGTITGISTLCVGSNTTLSNYVTGGTWSSSNPAVASIGSTGFVTAVAAGSSIISYTVTGTCGTAIATIVFTVGSLPVVPPISGASAICIGSSTTLTDATLGGIWSSSNPAVAAIGSTGIVTAITSGTTTISYTITGGCGSATTTQTVTVYPSPVVSSITGPTAVCTGASITLTDASFGGVWSASTGHCTVSTTGIVTGLSVGTDTITYTITTGCGSATATSVVTVNTISAGVITGLPSVCTGSVVSLSESITGGTWSSSSTSVATIGSTGIAAGIASGTALISYTVTNGCGTAVATFPLTVIPVPTVGAITGPSSVCIGSAAALIDGTSGGVWSSGSTPIATIGSTGTVTGVSVGTCTISYIVTTGCGTAIAVTTIDVVPAPVSGIISGPTHLCVGSTTSLGESVTGGTWSSSNITIGIVNTSGVLTGISGGVVTISYSVTNDCGTAVATYLDTLINLPDAGIITGSPDICEGTTSVLADVMTGGVWSCADTSVAAISSTGVVTGITAGITVISYTVSNTCGTSTAVTTITIEPLPYITGITGTTTITLGSTSTLVDGVPGGVWSSSDTTVATINTFGVVTGVNVGSAVITYTLVNSFGCNADTTIIVTVTLPSQIKNLSKNGGFNIYPNPASNELTISWHNLYAPTAKISLTDIIGREVLSKTTSLLSSDGATKLILNGIESGVYIISIKTNNEDFTGKLIITQ